MSQDVPVVLSPDWDARAFRSVAFAAFGDRISEFPFVRRDLLFLPLSLIIIPAMRATDGHAGIALAFKFLKFIVVCGNVALQLFGLLLWRYAGRHDHNGSPSAL